MVVGILNTFAALARATVLFCSVWRSIDCTPNAICGWWSMKMTCVFCGVRTSSFGLVMDDLLRLVWGLRPFERGMIGVDLVAGRARPIDKTRLLQTAGSPPARLRADISWSF